MKKYTYAASALLIMILLVCCGCGKSKIAYTLTVTGSAEKPGVLSFLNYDINVYQDEASNSCGDCADQPAHLYVGATQEDAAAAIAEAVERADDLWDVSEQQGNTVTLTERTAGSVSKKDFNTLDAPYGLTIEDNFGNKYVGKEDSASVDTEKTINNLDGSRLSVPVDPERLAAVYGPSYEALVVLGQEDKIVVCSDVQKDDFPWASVVFSRIGSLPCLENVHTSVSFEELMKYDPDLVFSFPRPNEEKQLEEAGICYVPGTTTKNLDEMKKLLLVYAHALGNGAVEKAESYNAYFDEKYQYITSRTSGLSDSDRPFVYYAGIDLLTTYGSYSDIPEVIEAAGGKAVTAGLKAGNHTQINFERLASWNPDFIFIDHGGIGEGETVEQLKNDINSDDQYKDINAVTEKQIYLTPSGVFYWDMGLQKVLLMMNMAKILHPDLFADLDMPSEVVTFYKTFYQYDLTYDQAQKILNRQDP